MGVIIISRFTDKRDIISDLVELMKKSVKITLYRIPEDEFEILNNIYQKYKA